MTSSRIVFFLTCAALAWGGWSGGASAQGAGAARPPVEAASACEEARCVGAARERLGEGAGSLPPVVATRLDALRQDLLRHDDGRALAAAILVEEPLRMLDAPTARRVALRLAAEVEAAPPTEARRLTAARLRRTAAVAGGEAGQVVAARDEVAALGGVGAWQVVGPFENRSMAGFDVAAPPEGRYEPAGRFEGKAGLEVGWRELKAGLGGYLDLGAAMNPSRAALAYAAATVDSPAKQRVALRIGAQGAYKLWVNGRLVARVDADAGAAMDADTWLVDLERGSNAILVKVAGERAELGFTLRVTTPSGAPVALKATPGAADGALLASATPFKGATQAPSPDAQAVEAARDAREDRAARWIAAATLTRALHPLDPRTPWRDLAREAVRAEPTSLDALMEGAAALPEHGQRLTWLEAAAELHPEHLWLQTRVALEASEGIGLGRVPERVSRLEGVIRAVESEGSVALLPRLLLAQVLAEQGQPRGAAEVIAPALAAWPGSRLLGAQRLQLAAQLGEARLGLEVGAKLLEHQPGDPVLAGHIARLELQAARPARARSILNAALEAHPQDTELHVLRATSLGHDPDAALQALGEALAASPRHPDLLSEQAAILERLGRRDEAVAALELALEIQPERRALEERIRALRPDADSFESPWRWSLDDLLPSPQQLDAWAGHDYVMLGSQQVTRVAPSGQSSRFHQSVIQILTPEGAKTWRAERVYYSPGYERVDVVSVRVRKRSGAVVEVHRRSDYDAGQGSGALYYQRRFAYLDVGSLEPGDVVEYAWREHDVAAENFREGYFGDLWTFEASVPVARARYVLLTPPELPVHARPPALASLKAQESTQQIGGDTFTARAFEATQLPAVRTDPSMPGRAEVFDYLLVSTYATWDEVGRWWWNLIKDQLVVDDAIRQVVQEVTRGVKNDRDKVRAIHNWVVKNTRYVGIEFGVHGWKPYRTTLCMQRRFGDCKDKASLIKVMLDAAGVECNLVLIRTNALGQVATSPANLAIFNHAIAYVPDFNLFLDGTAEYSGTSELPWSDQGTFAIVVKDGGDVRPVMTPIDAPDHNKHLRALEVDLTGGTALVKAEIVASGVDAVWYRRTFDNPEQARRDQALEGIVARLFPGARLKEARYPSVSDLEAPVQLHFTFQGGGFIKQVGDEQAIFPAGREIRLLDQYAAQATRDQDLVLGVPYTSENRVRYKLPPGLVPRRLPEPRDERGPFGAYRLQVTQRGDTLELDVSYSLASPRISLQDYPAFRAWLGSLDRALNQPIVLQRE